MAQVPRELSDQLSRDFGGVVVIASSCCLTEAATVHKCN